MHRILTNQKLHKKKNIDKEKIHRIFIKKNGRINKWKQLKMKLI